MLTLSQIFFTGAWVKTCMFTEKAKTKFFQLDDSFITNISHIRKYRCTFSFIYPDNLGCQKNGVVELSIHIGDIC